MNKNNTSSIDEFKNERNKLLKEMQSYPLDMKISFTKSRIREFVRKENAYFSFSGGKDSEVLVYIGAETLKDLGYTEMHVTYVNTGLEYLSVRDFVEEFCNYVEKEVGIKIILHKLTPKRNFLSVLTDEGYPVISKEVSQCIREARCGLQNNDGSYSYQIEKLNGTHMDKNGNLSAYNMPRYKFLLDAPFMISEKCCNITKKDPAKKFEEESGLAPIMATMACESRLRKTKWINNGCNVFDGERPNSCPMSFWVTNDVLEYIYKENLPIAPAYERVVAESEIYGQMDILSFLGAYEGCKYCTTGCDRTGCIFCLFGITQDLERILRLQKMEPKRADYVLRGGVFSEGGMWKPTKEGLGYWFILDYLREYGNINIPYDGEYGDFRETMKSRENILQKS